MNEQFYVELEKKRNELAQMSKDDLEKTAEKYFLLYKITSQRLNDVTSLNHLKASS